MSMSNNQQFVLGNQNLAPASLGADLARDNRNTYISHVRSVSPRESSLGSYSQLGFFGRDGSTAGNHLMPTAVEDFIKLKKELRIRQAEFEKDKALLMQKNEQLAAELNDTKERLSSKETMYEAMINTWKVNDSTSSQLLEAKLQQSERQAYEGEIAELKDFRRKLQEDLGNREHEYLKQISESDSHVKEMQLQIERLLLDKSQQLFQWEIERKELTQKLTLASSEKDQAEAMAELRYENKVKEMAMEIERTKLGGMVEIERIKGEYEKEIKEIKVLHEQEKQTTLEYRLDRQSHDLRSLHNMVVQQDTATNDTQEKTKQNRQQLSQEIFSIQAEVDGIKSQFEQTVAQLTKEKELAEQRNEKLQKQLEKIKNAPKQPAQVRIDLPFRASEQGSTNEESAAALQRQVKNLKEEVSLLQGDNEKLNDQVKKMRKEAQEMQDYAERLEANEKKLRQVLNDQAIIEQDQVVELRRQLNMEKKRVLEQSEMMSQVKEGLEKENHRQQTMIMEKENEIRTLNNDLRNHEKKLYDIQSMFNTQMVANNSMNMSGMVGFGDQGANMHQRGASQQYNLKGGLNMMQGFGGGSVAQSQGNFSPQKFANGGYVNGTVNQSLNLPQFYQQQSYQMHPMLIEGTNQYQVNFMDPHQMMLQSIQRMGDIIGAAGAQVECPHCYMTFDHGELQHHLELEHPLIPPSNQSLHGMTKAHSQTNLMASNYIGGGGPTILSRQTGAQSVCATSKSYQNLPHLTKRTYAEEKYTNQNDILQVNQNQPTMYLSQQPSLLGLGIPRNQTFNQQPASYPIVQASPRLQTQRFAPNNRSFTCLLKEIDEEEEKNIVGSHPGGSKLTRDYVRVPELILHETDSYIGGGGSAGEKKSRNMNSNVIPIQQDGAGSTVNYGMTATTGQMNTSKGEIMRPSNSSNASQTEIHVKPYTEHSRESIASLKQQSEQHQSVKEKSNITNEIKDLLDKLVTYQEDVPLLKKESQNSLSSHQRASQEMGQQNLMSTESLVELRSSDESSSFHIFGAEGKTYDFRPHATAQDIFKGEILKPSIGSGLEGYGVSSSVNNVYPSKKSLPKPKPAAVPVKNIGKVPNSGIPTKPKSKSKEKVLVQSKDTSARTKQGLTINITASIQNQQVKDTRENLRSNSRHSSSPHRNSSSSDEKPPSVDRETARHTSKDTIITNNLQSRLKNGRRYHQVNKSDVLTPNSPRRYQEYFKNKIQPGNTTGYTGSLSSIPQNGKSTSQTGGLISAVQGLSTNKPKTNNQGGMNTVVHTYQNHRYSPSITQSVVNESQYPSPEKPKVNKQSFVMEKSLLPMQNQLQNLPPSGKSSHPRQFYGNYDSGSVLCGGGPGSDYLYPLQMQNAGGFAHTNFIIAGTNKVAVFDNSMDDDGEIRPSQIDEFCEKKENKPATSAGLMQAHITSSYISIGEDDPFITGRFQDATTKQFNFKPEQAK